MRRVANYLLLGVLHLALAILILPAAAGVLHLSEFSSRDDVLKWLDGYNGE